MSFLSPVVGCLFKKAYKKGESQAPHDTPSYAPKLIEQLVKQADVFE